MGTRYKKITAKNFVLLIILFHTSCQYHRGGFYCAPMADDDVWRLPIIEPYELVTTAIKDDFWNISTYPYDAKKHRSYSVDSVNYNNGKIFIFSRYEKYLIIDIAANTDTTFENRLEFEIYNNERCFGTRLFKVGTLYENWRRTKLLPWSNQSGIMACSE